MSPEGEQQQQQPSGSLWQRNRPVFLLLGLVVVVGWEASATLYQHFVAPPTEQDWRDAVGVVKQHRTDNEPVLFAPLWVEPLGRFRFGGMLSDLDLATLSDVDRFPRVWEVSVRGGRHPWLAGKSPEQTWTRGGVQIALYKQKPADVTFDFFEKLASASVDRVGDTRVRCRRTMVRKAGRSTACPKFVCDRRRSWNWVGWHLAEVGHRPYHCVHAHPVDDHRMRISYPSVPIGSKMVLYTGIDDFENRKRAKAPVLMQVQINDSIIGTIKHRNDYPWHRTELDTSEHAGQTGAVTFEITTPLAYARPFCFAGDVRR